MNRDKTPGRPLSDESPELRRLMIEGPRPQFDPVEDALHSFVQDELGDQCDTQQQIKSLLAASAALRLDSRDEKTRWNVGCGDRS